MGKRPSTTSILQQNIRLIFDDAGDDPEDTTTVALTRNETLLVGTGLIVLMRLCPEVDWACRNLAKKMSEIMTFQGFIEDPDVSIGGEPGTEEEE